MPVEIDMDARVGEPDDRSRNVDYVVPAEPIDVVDLPEITVSDIDVEEESVSFTVDQIGVPGARAGRATSRTGRCQGAEGPYRVAPNFMVVVPTSTRGHADRTVDPSLDIFFYGLTLFGIALCFYWRWRGDVIYPMPTTGSRRSR